MKIYQTQHDMGGEGIRAELEILKVYLDDEHDIVIEVSED